MKKFIYLFLLLFSSNCFAYGSGGCDNKVVLLLHFNGVSGSTTFTDEACNGSLKKVITAQGNAQISTANAKFGSSGLFDGTGDYLTIPDSPDWVFGDNNFTVDFWVKFASTAGTQGLWAQTTDGTSYVEFYWDGSNWVFKLATANVFRVTLSAADTITTGVWYHVALIRGWGGNANTWEVTRDGVDKGGTTTTFTYPDYTSNFEIGNNTQGGLGQLNGNMAEFRVSSGVARWTVTGFTPPATPYCQGCEAQEVLN